MYLIHTQRKRGFGVRAFEAGSDVGGTWYWSRYPGCRVDIVSMPPFKGLDSFAGDFYHTGQWPHEPVDFSGRRVGVIGTGSSGCQAIPLIAAQAASTTVFQRTANYVIPAYNETLKPEAVQAIKRAYPEFRANNKKYPFAFSFETTGKSALEVTPEERERAFEQAWARGGLMFMGIFNDLLINHEANATAQDFFPRKLKSIIKDEATVAALMPDFALGCKRLIVGTDFYETFNRPNVNLVNVKDTPIECITTKGVTVGGREHEFDAIVFATGFDAISGPILNIDIHGKHGVAMRDTWKAGPSCYLGLMPAGFPNLFTITGPGSPSVLSNVLKSIEQHVDFIADCITGVREQGLNIIESNEDAEQAWLVHVDAIASRSVFKSCNSWYLGSNIPGKPRVFTAYIGWPQYAAELASVRADNYRGFHFGTVGSAESVTAG